MNRKKTGCVVLAAGLGRRFGGDKLLAEFGGKALIDWALEAVPTTQLDKTVVVSSAEIILVRAVGYGFTPVKNDAPELGLSRSICLGLEQVLDCDSVLFMVADQPKLRCETVARLVMAAQTHPDSILALSRNGKRGNPCIFPSEFYPELLALQGDAGGRSVIAAHQDRLFLMEAPETELVDIDDQETLKMLNGNLSPKL